MMFLECDGTKNQKIKSELMVSKITNRRILKIALPMVVSNATIPALGAVDTGVIGQLDDQILLAAVGMGAIVISTIYWFFGFLRMGTTGLVAQAKGLGDQSEVFSYLIRGVLIGLSAGLILIFIQTQLFWVALNLFQARPEVETQTELYLEIRIWSAPLSISNFAVLGWLIALERTLYVLYLQVFVNLINIILNLILVLHLGWGIEGVAYASLTAELLGAFLALIITFKIYQRSGHPKVLKIFSFYEWRKLFVTNINIFFRSLILEIVIISYVFFGSTLGTVILAANHILLQFVHIASYALDGFAFSAEALVGASYGTKSKEKIRSASMKSTIWAFICAILITLFLVMFSKKLIEIMVVDESIQTASIEHCFWMTITPITGVLSFMLDGIFIGATKARFMRKAMIQSFAVYIGTMALLFPIFENHGLWASINIFFIARAIFLIRYYPNVESFEEA